MDSVQSPECLRRPHTNRWFPSGNQSKGNKVIGWEQAKLSAVDLSKYIFHALSLYARYLPSREIAAEIT